MRVTADRDTCQAYGLCANTAPQVFTLDDDGYVEVIGDGTVPPGAEDDVAAAIRACPVQALSAE